MQGMANEEKSNNVNSYYDNYDAMTTKDDAHLVNHSVESVTPQCGPSNSTKHLLHNVTKGFLAILYLTLFAVAGIVAYNAINDYMTSVRNPVTSMAYREMDTYPAPGIVIFSSDINAVFLSCGHYYNDIVDPPTLDPNHKNCTYVNVSYPNPYFPERNRKAVVFRGPTKVDKKEILFINFSLNMTSRNFSGIEYLLFHDWYQFLESPSQGEFVRQCDIKNPTWTFSGGMLTWIKLALTETYYLDGSYDPEFDVEDSMVKYNDPRSQEERVHELFFVMYEWGDKFITEAHLVVTISPWNTVGVLCGVFLTLFKAGEFATKSIRWIIKARKGYKNKNPARS
ncbi:proton-activated chloride channel-like [Glandiceps talaboti]